MTWERHAQEEARARRELADWPPRPERFLRDRDYAKRRLRQAQAWVEGNLPGYEPQSPRAIMAELVAFITEVTGIQVTGGMRPSAEQQEVQDAT